MFWELATSELYYDEECPVVVFFLPSSALAVSELLGHCVALFSVFLCIRTLFSFSSIHDIHLIFLLIHSAHTSHPYPHTATHLSFSSSSPARFGGTPWGAMTIQGGRGHCVVVWHRTKRGGDRSAFHRAAVPCFLLLGSPQHWGVWERREERGEEREIR